MADDAKTLDDVITLLKRKRVLALTGAGISTESGIPDYRGPTTRTTARRPLQYREFVDRAEARQRYWARSVVGWPRIASSEPNRTHDAFAALEHAGVVTGIITQNVDRLHHKAGSERVIELHGALADVRCLSCGTHEGRAHLQTRLLEANPSVSNFDVAFAPDGDADIAAELTRSFVVLPCMACGGVLKPDVVYFGENVPRDRVELAREWVDAADALLVAGSSLTVFSGFRFVRRAAERGIPVVIVNWGESRGDPHASVKLDANVGEVIPALARRLT